MTSAEAALFPVKNMENLFRSLHVARLPEVEEIISVFESLRNNSKILKLAHELGVDQCEAAVAERNSPRFTLESYLYILFYQNVGDLPVLEYQDEAVLMPVGVGLNYFMMDDIDEILDCGFEVDSLTAFLVWINEYNDDGETFFRLANQYHWPFDEFVQVKGFPALKVIKNRLHKLGADCMLPAVIYGIYPPNNVFFNVNPDSETREDLEFTRENLDYLNAEYAKIEGVCSDYATTRDIVDADPQNLVYLAEALGAKFENGRRVRVRV